MGSHDFLYADDEEHDVFFMQRAFNKSCAGHSLTIARNGAEAIAKVPRACRQTLRLGSEVTERS